MNNLELSRQIASEAITPNYNLFINNIYIPQIVYHYTDQNAITSILKEKELWLSHALEMNDPDEIYFGISVIINILQRKLKSNSKILQIIIDENNSFYKNQSDFNFEPIFVISFSEIEDDLKQWVHYSNNAHGVSLELVLKKFENEIYRNNPDARLLIAPVYYYFKTLKPVNEDSISFESFIYNCFSSIDAIIENNNIEFDIPTKRLLFDYVLLFSSLIKQRLYCQEKEWRVVLRSGIGDSAIKPKIINNHLYMKYILNIDAAGLATMMNSIILGPKNYNSKTIVESYKSYIRKYLNGHTIHVRKSDGSIR